MHILATTSASLDDLVEPIDLGQAPGEMVVASFTDSDLAVLARAWKAGRHELPSLRLAPLAALRHPMSVDLWIDKVASRARVVVLRLLGGLDWWRYGAERLSAEARARGIALALLPGEDRDDDRLAALSTLPADELAALLACFRAGGPTNMAALLRRMARLAGRTCEVPPPQPVPLAGIYHWDGEAGQRSAPSPQLSSLWGEEAGCSGAGGARPYGEPEAVSPERRGLQSAPETLSPSGRKLGEGPSPSPALEPSSFPDHAPIVPVLFYRSMWLAADTAPVDALCAALAERGLAPRPIFVASLREPTSVALLRESFAADPPSVIVTLTAFASAEPGEDSVLDAPCVPVLQAVVATTRREAWAEGARGLTGADLAMHVVLPELDGRVLAGALSFKAAEPPDADLGDGAGGGRFINAVEPDRVAQVADRVARLVRLHRTASGERRIGILIPDYAGAPGRTGWAVGLDVPESVRLLLGDLAGVGYRVEAIPPDARVLLDELAGGEASLDLAVYRRHLAGLPEAARTAMLAAWGEPEADPDVADDAFHFRAKRFGHVWVAIAPERGSRIERRAQYHDPALPPRHALLAFGLWLREVAGLDALVHMGAHGTLEWLPGKQAALTAGCFPELVLGALPVAYPFIVSNPGEAAQAKRRIAAVTLGHLPPPMIEGAESGERAGLERLVEEYAEAEGLDRRRRERLARLIVEEATRLGVAREAGVAAGGEDIAALQAIDGWLCDLKEMRLKDGFHLYGRGACGEEERAGLLAALDGRRVKAGPAGAPGRGRSDVLPTGRNIFASDPRTLPTRTAMDLGRLAAEEVLRAYLQDHGAWPRRLVLDLWGSASLRTGGEEIAQGLALMGCRPLWDAGTGRITGIEVLPPAVLGRPRVDVTFRISGLFRDLFPAQIALIDAALKAVAAREESVEENPLRAEPDGPRIFGSAPGAYGAGLADLPEGVPDRDALGAAYLDSARFVYGGAEGIGRPAGEAFAARVAQADLLLHGADDPGRDLLEGDADLAFIGGFAAAAARLGHAPDLVVLDTADPARPRARPLAQALARIVHGRVAPRYIAGLLRHGPRGAAEIAETVDRLVGFAAATPAVSGHLIERLHAAYVADTEVRDFLAAQSPEAARLVARRFSEAQARGLWHPRRNDVAADLATLAGEAAQ
ncbi:cobaltochelatase subunit CobN [Ancylobacter sp. 6x-1]|uniref:Cobaltochelatase subunit CobN n=1 Tax=Ancylobacter crimeensis TaxID=2579147 RepID=A0ABT0D9G0_9HYPH|nr:cobaltochelatase subunit CobN [Ancylobacter crimeensis]MCK0196572.1 cobaltochelatase subunit CobN [Ancylobacter crimeensis]